MWVNRQFDCFMEMIIGDESAKPPLPTGELSFLARLASGYSWVMTILGNLVWPTWCILLLVAGLKYLAVWIGEASGLPISSLTPALRSTGVLLLLAGIVLFAVRILHWIVRQMRTLKFLALIGLVKVASELSKTLIGRPAQASEPVVGLLSATTSDEVWILVKSLFLHVFN